MPCTDKLRIVTIGARHIEQNPGLKSNDYGKYGIFNPETGKLVQVATTREELVETLERCKS